MKSIPILIIIALFTTNASAQGALTTVPSFGSNPGNLTMYSYVPAGINGPVSLVVAMHGCSQSAAIYSLQSGWNKLAEKHKFIMVYPEQVSANNSSKCFNWFEAGDQSKNQGEALSVKQMVDYMKLNYAIDSAKIFVTGLSAGAGMTTVMLATYPEVFSKGAIMAGLPYKASSSALTASSAMGGFIVKTPAQWGDLVRNENPSYSGPFPKAAIFHGAVDFTVNSINATELIDQWTNVNNADQTADFTNSSFDGNNAVEQTIYMDNFNNPVVYYYKITGMGHGISVDTGSCSNQGGTTGTYTIEKNFHSTYWAAEFFDILTTASLTISLCAGETLTIGTHTYSTTNTYLDTLTALNGCDSILTTHLTVFPASPSSLNIAGNDSLCNTDAAFVLSGGIPLNGYYSGSGVISGSFYPSNAIIGWNIITYTVMDTNNCSTTAHDSLYVSSCLTTGQATDFDLSENVIIYPNPATDAVEISINGSDQFEVYLYNTLGELILVKKFIRTNTEIDIHSLHPGLYLLNVRTATAFVNHRMIKK